MTLIVGLNLVQLRLKSLNGIIIVNGNTNHYSDDDSRIKISFHLD